MIVEREKSLEALEQRIEDLRARSARQGGESSEDMRALEDRYAALQRDMFGHLTPWERVNMARHPRRPIASDYIARLDEFDELHGDRQFRDDPALVGGLGRLNGRRIVVLAQQKGRDTKENIRRNFGMVTPEGYRKARRLMELAGRFALPIVSFVDTSGADPGIASEERSQSEAIASCLLTLSRVPVPVVAAIIGEGGSGGALAIALADHVIMLEHSIYSVASPEGCAAILWADASRAEEAAARLKLTSDDLLGFGIVDEIVSEPLGGAHRDADRFVGRVLGTIDAALSHLSNVNRELLVERRRAKYRRIGAWQETSQRFASVAAR
ncbi:MAG: acetyl-CoA carboxylase carboxyltransferase subunit alpha [Candidatus Eremiobacteraeota bacterium]|nr:acetyl-CoA carboxylase carboxyltransferase subunit alpha [Candidatus Eremiobacteraeota bacterium]MBV9646519.1 acetyl-CoA carboxylase carboxyltransferase subunit alpha [Candidatus Eremiobacteraeota bacterium]